MIWISALLVVPLAYLAVLAARERRRRAAFARPLPSEWRAIVERNVPIHSRLPGELRDKLHKLINVFLAEKRFFGCAGLEITDEIRVTVAAHACILLLNRPKTYYSNFISVFVYPKEFQVRVVEHEGGIVSEGEQIRLGEAHRRGPIVLAWDSVLRGAHDMRDGHNVALHEFAHKLDEEDGAMDGAPVLPGPARYASWAKVMSREFEALARSKEAGRETVVDYYGATNPAEFFAVVTETFFERPRKLRKMHGELYDTLEEFYGLDPASWPRGPGDEEPPYP